MSRVSRVSDLGGWFPKLSPRAIRQWKAYCAGALAVGAGGGVEPVTGLNVPMLGCMGVVRSNGWAGYAIRIGTRSRWNHIVTYVGDIPGYGPAVVEARPDGAVLTGLYEFYREALCGGIRFAWALEDPAFVGVASGWRTEEDVRAAVAAEALAMLATPYGWWGLVSIGALQFGLKWEMFRHKVRQLNEAFCSQLHDTACLGAGVHLFDDGRPPGDVSPGDLARRNGVVLYDIFGKVWVDE